MNALIALMITWTDVFYAIGDFFQWIFKGMRGLGQIPNIIISFFILYYLVSRIFIIMKQNKEADSNGTLR